MKEIQEERMKRYFIDACKSIIRGEGVNSVSVRTVSEKAGYSYTTLYNYFKDIKDLFTICAEEFLNESEQFIIDRNIKSNGKQAILDKSMAFAMFFVQYPSIFKLVFTEDIRELRSQTTFKDHLDTIFNNLLSSNWKEITIANKEIKEELIKNTIYSSLLLYLNRFSPKNYNEFIDTMNKQIKHILEF